MLAFDLRRPQKAIKFGKDRGGVAQEDVAFRARQFDELRVWNEVRGRTARFNIEHGVVAAM